ncbi:MAG: hypothetical protein WCP21_18005 [Armatimonadota bacterium]
MSRWKWTTVMAALAAGVTLTVVGWPVMTRHQAKGQWRACLTNVKLLSLTMQVYADDADGRLPIPSAYPNALLPYESYLTVRNFLCPSDRNHAVPGYAFVPRWAGVKRDDMEKPSCAVMLYDADGVLPSYRHWAEEWPEASADGGPTIGLVVGYCDGHVMGNSARQFTQRNIDTGRDSDFLSNPQQ